MMKKVFERFLSTLPYLFAFLSSLYSPTDPDLGWHLKYGEHFFKTGNILRDNTFSVMMPDYKWANTSWLTDIFTYSAFSLAGFVGLILLSASVVTLTLFFFSKAARLTIWDEIFIFPLILYLNYSLNIVSFRGQQLSLLLLGIMYYILTLYKKNKKALYLLIPLFVLWVNLHGQFVLGLALLYLWTFIYLLQRNLGDFDKIHKIKSIRQNLIKNKNEITYISKVVIFSTIGTLINPFGFGVHRDAISHIGSPLLKNIAEYLPFPLFTTAWWNQVIVAVILGIGITYFLFKEKIILKSPLIISAIMLYVFSFSIRRFAWPAYYLIMPILKPLPGIFKPDSKKYTNLAILIISSILIIIISFEKIPFNKYTSFTWNDYCQNIYVLCSEKAAEYLSRNKLNKKIFTQYSWGGFLIWNYPDVKPLIDGRMHMWRDDKGYSGFEEYYMIEQNITDIHKTDYEVVWISSEKLLYKRLINLEQEGKWKKVFEDQGTFIFVRQS